MKFRSDIIEIKKLSRINTYTMFDKRDVRTAWPAPRPRRGETHRSAEPYDFPDSSAVRVRPRCGNNHAFRRPSAYATREISASVPDENVRKLSFSPAVVSRRVYASGNAVRLTAKVQILYRVCIIILSVVNAVRKATHSRHKL